MKHLRLFLAVALAVVLTACATTGIGKPTFLGTIDLSYKGITAMSNTFTTGVQLGKFGKKDADNIVTMLRTIHQGLSVTQDLYLQACPVQALTGQPDPACAPPVAALLRFNAADTAMKELQKYIDAQIARQVQLQGAKS